uniref:AlNc14C21G2146 protein n=1 Tax=Albugo laibachii Nc14 TaxID=890382 RepID=F0W5I1_9STRA|nr:AlNc14C21G2146 [Albugo laibachii Nc14]|eukprot:CCA16372.1 AlNc14C21G2146 [Albugo laibachii Nc14]
MVQIDYRVERHQTSSHHHATATVCEYTAEKKVPFQNIVEKIEEIYEKRNEDATHTERFQMLVTIWANILDRQLPDTEEC